MIPIDVYELSQRVDGSYDLAGLSEVERKLFLLYDFRIIQEMEGFTHYVGSYRNPHVKPIHSFLLEIGDQESAAILKRLIDLVDTHIPSWDPDDVDAFFCGLPDEKNEEIDQWGWEYYGLIPRRWEKVDKWLESSGRKRVE